MNTGLCFKRAINKSTSTSCTTWCKFTVGEFSLTSLQHVDCLEAPSTGLIYDGAPRKFQDAQGREIKVHGVKKVLAVLFSVGADGITLQQNGFGQVYTQCLSPYTEQQLHAQLGLMREDLQMAFGKAGLQIMQQSALPRGGGWQGGSASASGNLPLM